VWVGDKFFMNLGATNGRARSNRLNKAISFRLSAPLDYIDFMLRYE